LEDGDNSSENIVNVPNPVIDQCIDINSKSLEDKEMNNFLDEKNKAKDLSPVNHNISSDILYNIETINDQDSCKQKKGEALIQKISLEKNHINENLSSDQKAHAL
ncbi:14662_t:CDS:2, partial [Racocetra persica]